MLLEQLVTLADVEVLVVDTAVEVQLDSRYVYVVALFVQKPFACDVIDQAVGDSVDVTM